MQETFFGSDIVDMVLNAGLMAKFVLIVLLIFSIISWAIIFMKLRLFNKIKTESEEFLELFW
ncbi:MAG: Tol-Pal system subunit TolQ, partial [Deltaproteobacteria bacterium]